VSRIRPSTDTTITPFAMKPTWLHIYNCQSGPRRKPSPGRWLTELDTFTNRFLSAQNSDHWLFPGPLLQNLVAEALHEHVNFPDLKNQNSQLDSRLDIR